MKQWVPGSGATGLGGGHTSRPRLRGKGTLTRPLVISYNRWSQLYTGPHDFCKQSVSRMLPWPSNFSSPTEFDLGMALLEHPSERMVRRVAPSAVLGKKARHIWRAFVISC